VELLAAGRPSERVLSLDHQCPGRTVGARARDRRLGGVHRGAAPGEEYLLERNLFRRKSTGEVAHSDFLRFSFPTQWHYDVLRALDYFRAAGDPPDERMDEAVQVLRSKRQSDGTWLLENTHAGAVHFPLENGDDQPSRWNTLRASRVLNWYG
jgi:hypothetical protein